MSADIHYLEQTISLASESLSQGGFPVGAIIVADGSIVGTGKSSVKLTNDITAHAEVEAIRACGDSLPTPQSSAAVLYSSLEPCMMCLAVAARAGVRRIVFACSRAKVSTEYYESIATAKELAESLNSAIEVQHIAVLEAEQIELIKQYEAQ